ncbi:MAG: hypothetical protein HN778_09695 [Prolixibacteraceae bacterium]|nr:hypothetical protein [Prolixibacteraceae bacterium]MBT6765526.1 hypothetical protein [Prolixibacteraceae bacterium]MBT7000084.1 hypothetical protein [Prolixibacteraceae bacterium]MBT7395092.1 hypothetical protein [Prolixibacteraceae bacterium]
MVLLGLPGGLYLALQNSRVQTVLTQKLANQISKQINSKINIGKVDFAFFDKIILNNVLVEGQNNDTLFYTEIVEATIDTLNYRKRKITLDNFSFENSKIKLIRDSVSHFNFSYILDSLQTEKDTSGLWKIKCNRFGFRNSMISFQDLYSKKGNNFFINDLNFDISGFAQHSDSVRFKINDLNLNDGKKLFLKHLAADFHSSKNKIQLKNINLQTNHSTIKNTEFSLLATDESKPSFSEIDIRFSDSKVSFYELAELIPSLKGMDQVVNCSGQVSGNLNDLKGKNLLLKTGKNTSAFFDFYANGIQNIESMYLFIDLKQSNTNFTDLAQIKLPANSRVRYLNFPKSFYKAGLLNYKGNFSGFLSDFVAFGTFSSEMGILTTDVSLIPDREGSILYRGKVTTSDFQLGELFQNENFGTLTFDGSVDGNFNKSTQTIFGEFKGDIAEIEAKQYAYKNIILDGILDNKMFNGMLSINDPNLVFDFIGRINLNPEIPDFNFKLNLEKAILGKLNLSKNFPASELAFEMLANFTGDRIDNLRGSIELENGVYQNRNGDLNLKGIKLASIPGDLINSLTFTSGFFDIGIVGNYHFQSILKALEKSINNYLPATNYEIQELVENNIFDYQIDVKNLDEITTVFTPGLEIETPFLLYGTMDSENSIFNLEGSIPGFSTKKLWVKNIFIGNKPVGNLYSSKFRFGEILSKNGMAIYNLTVDSKISDNIIDNQITWTNYHDLTYSGTIKTRSVFSETDSTKRPHIEIEGLPTKIFIADSIWQIDPFSASIDTSTIEISNFRFYNKNQIIAVNGKISEKKQELISINIENIKLNYLDTYLNKEIFLNGIVNGSIGLSDFYGQRLITSDIGIKDFGFKNQKIGDIKLSNNWDKTKSLINSELKINNRNRQNLYASGNFNPANKELNYIANFDHLSLVLLETVMSKNFSNFHGDVSGNLKINGETDQVLLNGTLEGSNAGVTVDFTQVSYNFNDSVHFKGDTIHFDNIAIQDVYKNKGNFDGTIIHQNFQKMDYNLTMSSPEIMVMNTTRKNNEQFFGQVLANGSLHISGHGTQVNLDGLGTTLHGTNVNISLDYESEIKQYDFIQFVSTETSEKQKFLFPEKKKDDFSLNLTIRATPDARAQLIYNSQIGDIIKAQGEGILLFGMDKDGKITLSGNYTVEKGDYLFTLQNVINKRFTIDQGGSIVWSGNPYNAIININAVYKLKASLYDLLVNSYENIYQSQRIPVDCKILMSEELSNPLIDFEIEFPTVEDRIVDQVQQFFNTDEEMNKQMLSLLVLGKFYTPEYMRGTYEAQNPNVIGTTASELFSNQLSNWLSQISNNVDVGLNYRPGNQITDDEIELALSTQMFNDRVTVNGNIGNNVNPHSNNNSQLVGDFDINVKLNPSGKIQFKAYNRSNNNLIYETAPYTQGVGFSFKEEYNSFNELLKKIGAMFERKKRL